MSTRRPAGTPLSIKHLLTQALGHQPQAAAKLEQYRLWSCWDELVGATIARHASPLKMQETTLVVGVSDPSWMQELTYLQPQLLEKLHTRVAPALLTEIRFVLRRG